jgi:hypothetical protein
MHQLRRPLALAPAQARRHCALFTVPSERVGSGYGIEWRHRQTSVRDVGMARWDSLVLSPCVFPLVAQSGVHVIDHSNQILQDASRSLYACEMELFVPARHLIHSAGVRRMGAALLRRRISSDARSSGRRCPWPNVVSEVEALKGSYVHDYVITLPGQVLRDDTLDLDDKRRRS